MGKTARKTKHGTKRVTKRGTKRVTENRPSKITIPNEFLHRSTANDYPLTIKDKYPVHKLPHRELKDYIDQFLEQIPEDEPYDEFNRKLNELALTHHNPIFGVKSNEEFIRQKMQKIIDIEHAEKERYKDYIIKARRSIPKSWNDARIFMRIPPAFTTFIHPHIHRAIKEIDDGTFFLEN